eukprot:CAMPEP_0113455224 /NCGR_PEP_ID=MMETSP0014_2-20120614/8265_1 /TAXON_ID=2857 /ORGANISM="Nitzschia sp." /LENGTH=675 /DNA_ID=CAMNT_0000346647 /DNA_START=1825 /DNA_END=3852 /DNA_ORIENTATION=- /assembly_acc=CAM_ASM_000159
MKVVTVPEFSFALVFDTTTDLTTTAALEVDETILSKSTASYLQTELQAVYPCLHRTIDLKLRRTRKNHAFDDKNKSYRYWRCDVSVSFDDDVETEQSTPSGDDVFIQIGETLNGDIRADKYLTHLKKQSKLNVTEVQASLKRLEPTEGGVVKSPNFYISLQCDPAPTRQPTPEEKQRLIGLLLPAALKSLHEQHRDFIGMDDLRIVKTEINEQAGKPVVAFNLYIEFEATGSFVRNSPPAMVFFSTIANNLPEDFIVQLATNIGGDFSNIRRMAINPVAYIENLHDDLPADGCADIVPIHIEFWIAFKVENFSKNARMSDTEILTLDTVMEKTVDERLASVYGRNKYVGIKTMAAAGPIEYQAGLPLPRFNVLRRYQADVNMTNPVPKPHLVLQKVMKSNIAGILMELGSLSQSEESNASSGSNWARLKEATMGTADLNQMALKNKEFGGKKSPGSRKKKENKTKRIEVAKKIDNPMPNAEDETPNLNPEENPKFRPPPIDVKPLSVEPKSAPEANRVGPKKTEPDPENKREFIVCTALTIDQCRHEPSDEDYEKLISNANEYLSTFLSDGDSEFSNGPMNMAIRHREFGTGINARKDVQQSSSTIYIEWDVVVGNVLSSQDDDGGFRDINYFVGKKMMKPMDFLMNVVRKTKGTAFADATAIEVGVRKLGGTSK